MKKFLTFISTLLLCVNAFAANEMCRGDSMRFDGDKQSHMLYSAAIGAAARSIIKAPELAFALALVPGAARELWLPDGCFSRQDMFYNVVGATIGVTTTHWIIGPNKVIYTTEF